MTFFVLCFHITDKLEKTYSNITESGTLSKEKPKVVAAATRPMPPRGKDGKFLKSSEAQKLKLNEGSSGGKLVIYNAS